MTTPNLLFVPLPIHALPMPSWLGPHARQALQLDFHADAAVLVAPRGTGKTAALLSLARLLEAHACVANTAADANSPAQEQCP